MLDDVFAVEYNFCLVMGVGLHLQGGEANIYILEKSKGPTSRPPRSLDCVLRALRALTPCGDPHR